MAKMCVKLHKKCPAELHTKWWPLRKFSPLRHELGSHSGPHSFDVKANHTHWGWSDLGRPGKSNRTHPQVIVCPPPQPKGYFWLQFKSRPPSSRAQPSNPSYILNSAIATTTASARPSFLALATPVQSQVT